MNSFMNKLERNFGRYAIPNLTMYIIGLYVIGYVLELVSIRYNMIPLLTLNPILIFKGQIWRLVSWVLIPPTGVSILTIITLIFYYFVGNNMERTMGTFRYNVFVFGGMILMIIGAFLAYGTFLLVDPENAAQIVTDYASVFSTYYLQQMVFLAFAICYPEVQILLMFIIPIKVKWLGIAYGVILLYSCLQGLMVGNFCVFFAIGSQLLNLFLFYVQTGRLSRFKPKDVKRRHDFSRNVKMAPRGITRHKCAVCGRTEETNPELEFRFCSKCNGNYEYCQEHLFTHQHIK
ncbi:hypothetical protein [Butyrivibrio sp. MC2021]|uniref:hypothetical protein n=1 Tax=Butyrivibrio sp. MC2021 TaxID=1408306 RepID=UPI00047BDF55|nr:hypothetical protein [Butyrivibrio sp. MC2021]